MDSAKEVAAPALTPIIVGSKSLHNPAIALDGSYQFSGYGHSAPIGYNNRGVEELTRINMSLRSGLESEVTWALSTLTRLSAHTALNLNKVPYLGHELIKYFIRPYQYIIDKQLDKFDTAVFALSLDCLLSLRNLAQDLPNHQWLSQVKLMKKYLVEVLKFLSGWFYNNAKIYSLMSFENQFFEAFKYLLDLLQPLTCYYIDTSKNDPLFNTLLSISTKTNDKTIFITILKCLSHLLIVRQKTETMDDSNDKTNSEDEDNERTPNNCIDSIKDTHLEFYINHLLINDNEVTSTVLQFLKQYLFSTAPHPKYPNSVKESQYQRLLYLLQVKTTKSNFNTLLKTLPLLTVSNLPLTDPTNLRALPQSNLTKRSQFCGVPSTLPELPQDLYKIIIRFPEPLRATSWLRCCYEPYLHSNQATTNPENNDAIPGEVTQISLWKAYEKQFQEIWEPSTAQQASHLYKPLLPAVDFIKNVTHAFPNSEAMVVNLDSAGDGQPKKKFIIKGIQPRQFAVSLDVGNYEALKPATVSSTNPSQNYKLPIGHIDGDKFAHSLNTISETIVTQNAISLDHATAINVISSELLGHIIREVYDNNEKITEENLFKLYNKHWLPDLIYANPSLVETGLVNGKWLKYLI